MYNYLTVYDLKSRKYTIAYKSQSNVFDAHTLIYNLPFVFLQSCHIRP